MSKGQWSGLVTDASPYAIPPGAAAEQTNISSAVPGQISVRGGMRSVVVTGEQGPLNVDARDCAPYATGTSSAVLIMDASGNLVLAEGPASGSAPSLPLAPSVSTTGDRVKSNYVHQFGFGGDLAAP